MHLKQLIAIGSVAAFIILVTLSSPLPAVAGSLGENVGKALPVIYSPINEFEFSAVIDGTKVLHEFYVLNKGSEVLIIQNVLTGWGCAAVSFSRQIPPGGEGRIAIQVDTTGYGGKKLEKIAEVHSNDPKAPIIKLKIFGQVNKFATITPNMLNLRGISGQRLNGIVKIIPEDKYPFKVIGVETTHGKVNLAMQEVIDDSKKVYVLTVENLITEAGSYNDTVVIKTDNPIRPELQLRVYVYLSPKISRETGKRWFGGTKIANETLELRTWPAHGAGLHLGGRTTVELE